MPLRGKEIAEYSGGTVLQGDPERVVTGFAIDSRQVREGDFFIPLKGEREDGHTYVTHALEQGAAGAFYAREPLPPLPPESLIIAVQDPLQALQRTAAAYRRRFNLTVIGITGSSGKTTTKDFTAAVLGQKMAVLKTPGNLNNEIGLPLALLALEERHRAAVLEMGMSAPGEITALAQIAAPAIGVITNIGEAHLELLGSVEAIARAKGELLDYLGAEGIAVLNGDDPRLVEMGKRFPGKAYFYGLEKGDIRCLQLSRQGEKSFFRVRFPGGEVGDFSLPLPGDHLVSNALAAAAVGWLLGVDPGAIQAGLQECRVTGGRLEVVEGPGGFRIIDDSYNANPASVRASLKVLADLAGEKGVAVLGDMLELGPAGPALHRAVGRFAARCRLGALIAVGELAREMAAGAREEGLTAVECSHHADAVEALRRLPLSPGWYVLVKGSRGMAMENVVRALSSPPEGDQERC